MNGTLTTISTFGWFGSEDPVLSMSLFGWDDSIGTGSGIAIGGFSGAGYMQMDEFALAR